MRALSYMLVAGTVAALGCGKTDSKSIFDAESANKQSSRQYSIGNSPDSDSSLESERASQPQSAAGAYLTCAPYTRPTGGANGPTGMGCMVRTIDDRRMKLNSFPNRKWVVKDDGDNPIAVTINEMKNDLEADVVVSPETLAANGPKIDSVEFHFDTAQNGLVIASKNLQSVRIKNKDLTKELGGVWSVSRMVQSASFFVQKVRKNAGKLQINFLDAVNFEAVVEGPNKFELDYGYAEKAGTKIFTGKFNLEGDLANLLLLQTKVIPDPKLTPAPVLTLDKTTGHFIMKVVQPQYGATIWEMSR